MTAAPDHDAYEQTQDVRVAADYAFAFLSDVANLPSYLPPIISSEAGPGERVVLQGQAPSGEQFEGTGYYRVDSAARRMEWGAQIARAYSGWLTVEPTGEQASTVRVHLEFGPESAQPEVQQHSGDRDPAVEALEGTLETIRRQLEGEGGQVDPTPLPEEARQAATEKQQQRPDVDVERP